MNHLEAKAFLESESSIERNIIKVAVDGEVVYVTPIHRMQRIDWTMLNTLIYRMGGEWHREGGYWFVAAQLIEQNIQAQTR